MLSPRLPGVTPSGAPAAVMSPRAQARNGSGVQAELHDGAPPVGGRRWAFIDLPVPPPSSLLIGPAMHLSFGSMVPTSKMYATFCQSMLLRTRLDVIAGTAPRLAMAALLSPVLNPPPPVTLPAVTALTPPHPGGETLPSPPMTPVTTTGPPKTLAASPPSFTPSTPGAAAAPLPASQGTPRGIERELPSDGTESLPPGPANGALEAIGETATVEFPREGTELTMPESARGVLGRKRPPLSVLLEGVQRLSSLATRPLHRARKGASSPPLAIQPEPAGTGGPSAVQQPEGEKKTEEGGVGR